MRKKPAAAAPTSNLPPDVSPGSFRPDGSWTFQVERDESHDPQTSLYWFVDMLVARRRRTPHAPPSIFAARIKASPFEAAFPNADEWLSSPGWAEIHADTSAERCVLDLGCGADRERIAALTS